MFKHVLLASDGSEPAAKAVERGLALAKLVGADATAVTVSEPNTVPTGRASQVAQRIEVLRLSQEIGRQTKAAIDERQREVLLREQLATIRRQLGEGEDGKAEIAELSDAIGKASMPKEVDEQARKELRRLERMPKHQPNTAWFAAISTGHRAAMELTGRGADRHRCSTARSRRRPLWTRKNQTANHRVPCRCASSRRTARHRFCVWSARPASARPRWGNPLRAPCNENSCGRVLEACTTRQKFAVIAALTSVPCLGTSFRPSAKQARVTVS